MPRGQPDFGIYTETPVASGISDPGEAAARLGSINIYDRRGWTIWMDDFEAPMLRWDAASPGDDVVPVLDTTRSVSGVQCVKLACGIAVNPSSQIKRHFPLIRLGRVGVEFWTQMKIVEDSILECDVHIWDGSNFASFIFWYYPFIGRLSISDPDGLNIIAEKVYMSIIDKYFLPFKFVVDMDTDYYTRLLVGEREFDISSYRRSASVPSTDRAVGVLITLHGVNTQTTFAYIDNFILTQNEP